MNASKVPVLSEIGIVITVLDLPNALTGLVIDRLGLVNFDCHQNITRYILARSTFFKKVQLLDPRVSALGSLTLFS